MSGFRGGGLVMRLLEERAHLFGDEGEAGDSVRLVLDGAVDFQGADHRVGVRGGERVLKAYGELVDLVDDGREILAELIVFAELFGVERLVHDLRVRLQRGGGLVQEWRVVVADLDERLDIARFQRHEKSELAADIRQLG